MLKQCSDCLGATVRKAAWNSNRRPRFPKANLNIYRLSETPSELSKTPRAPMLHSPLPWPDGAHPAKMVAMNLRHVLAVVSRLDAKGVGTICEWIERGRDVS